MLTVKRIVAFCIGALALLKDVVRERRTRSPPSDGEVAGLTRCHE
jgi:hypothetical protein